MAVQSYEQVTQKSIWWRQASRHPGGFILLALWYPLIIHMGVQETEHAKQPLYLSLAGVASRDVLAQMLLLI